MIHISNRREKTKTFYIVKARDSIEDISFKNGNQKQNKIKKSMSKLKINNLIPSIIKLVNLLSKMNLKFLINLKILILMINLRKRKEKQVIFWLNKLTKTKRILKTLLIKKIKQKNALSRNQKIKKMIQKVVTSFIKINNFGN